MNKLVASHGTYTGMVS